MITCYKSIQTCLTLYYLEGVFLCMEMDDEDKIIFDVYRHDVEIYEEDLDQEKFVKIDAIKYVGHKKSNLMIKLFL